MLSGLDFGVVIFITNWIHLYQVPSPAGSCTPVIGGRRLSNLHWTPMRLIARCCPHSRLAVVPVVPGFARVPRFDVPASLFRVPGFQDACAVRRAAFANLP